MQNLNNGYAVPLNQPVSYKNRRKNLQSTKMFFFLKPVVYQKNVQEKTWLLSFLNSTDFQTIYGWKTTIAGKSVSDRCSVINDRVLHVVGHHRLMRPTEGSK